MSNQVLLVLWGIIGTLTFCGCWRVAAKRGTLDDEDARSFVVMLAVVCLLWPVAIPAVLVRQVFGRDDDDQPRRPWKRRA